MIAGGETAYNTTRQRRPEGTNRKGRETRIPKERIGPERERKLHKIPTRRKECMRIRESEPASGYKARLKDAKIC